MTQKETPGIIDIRLKKDKNLGANGSIRATMTQGQKNRSNANFTGNYRSKKVNVFTTLGAADGESFNDINFRNWQNDLFLVESNYIGNEWQNLNYRAGADFYIGNRSIIGVLSQRNDQHSGLEHSRESDISISEANGDGVDSILVADSFTDIDRLNQSYNINYRFDDREKKQSLNIDLDYGSYSTDAFKTLA